MNSGMERQGCLGRIESLIAMLAALFLSMLLAGGAWVVVSVLAESSDEPRLPYAIATAVIVSVIDLWFAVLVFRCYSRRMPALPLAVAVRQPLLPIALRPLPAAYWCAHFVAGAVLVMTLHRDAGKPDARLAWADIAFLTIFSYVLTYAANIYLLAAIASLTRRPAVLALAWRLRLLIDLLVALGTPLAFGKSEFIRLWIG